MQRLSRREWLASAGLLALAGNKTASGLAQDGAGERKTLPVAGVVTAYHENSHADVILGKILNGFDQAGGKGPDLKLVSLYTDQVPKNDLSRELAKQYGFPIVKSIDEAITLGTGEVQVAGVISIGEHGDYPYVEKTQQHMYPRRRFFDEITAAFGRCGKVVPVFNDKHLAYNWRDAKHMYDTAVKMKIPMMAGSSVPVSWRVPELVLPKDCQIEAALSIGYGGPESYGFHALEGLQCMTERRRGGETGVAAVQAVKGDAVWQAERDGRWSRVLLNAALETMPNKPTGKIEEKLQPDAPFYLIDYRDGLKAAVAMANGLADQFCFAAKLRGQEKPVATWFKLQEEKPFGHFAFLLQAIEKMIHSGAPTYPVERTLVTTGILDAALHSLADEGRRLATPELDVRYTSVD